MVEIIFMWVLAAMIIVVGYGLLTGGITSLRKRPEKNARIGFAEKSN